MALVKKEPKDVGEADEAMETEERGKGDYGESAISREYDRSQLPELLKIYYRWLFPYDKYFDWLQYGEPVCACVRVCVCVCVCVFVCLRVCVFTIIYQLHHLSVGDPDTFSHREFSFTLADDVYVRYQSFDSREALEEGVRKATPYKMDIGAIFSVKVNKMSLLQQ